MKGPEDKILCQLRDDKAGILFPGYWTCTPGGHVNEGEDLFQAIERELWEEFEIRVKDLALFKTSTETSPPIAGRYHFFVANLSTPPKEIKCLEGQRASLFTFKEALELKQHPLSRRILEEYLSTFRGTL